MKYQPLLPHYSNSTSYTWKVPYVRKKTPTPCPKFVGWNRATAPSLLHRERFKCCCVYDLRKFWILLVLGQERFIYRGKVICHFFFFLLLGYFCLFRLGSSQMGTMRWLILLYCVCSFMWLQFKSTNALLIASASGSTTLIDSAIFGIICGCGMLQSQKNSWMVHATKFIMCLVLVV